MNETTSHDDSGRGALRLLGLHEPSAPRDARLRERCRAALLEAHRLELTRAEPVWRFAIGMAVGPAVVGVLCAVYLFEVLSRALLLYRF